MLVVKYLAAAFLSFFFLSSLTGSEAQREYTISGFAQGTSYTVKYYATDSLVDKASIERLLMQIDSSMSLYKPYSLISRFNNNASGGMVVDAHFAKVMRKASEITRATDGHFDVTVAPLVNAWGFGPDRIRKLPDSATVRELLKCVGMDKVSLKGNYLSKQLPCVKVDLNGIAQGYTVDVLASHLRNNNIKSFIIELGGEVLVQGRKPDGIPYRVGIEGPQSAQQPDPVIKHSVALRKGAMTTSGNYRKYVSSGKSKFSHLIDPRTGYPLRNQMISVTVYAKDAITADGYDNALMSLGVEEALALANKKHLEVYMIYRKDNGEITDTLSAGFRKMILSKELK